jgi:3-oxo-5-alpha-steroid 4-dehydrogenase 1
MTMIQSIISVLKECFIVLVIVYGPGSLISSGSSYAGGIMAAWILYSTGLMISKNFRKVGSDEKHGAAAVKKETSRLPKLHQPADTGSAWSLIWATVAAIAVLIGFVKVVQVCMPVVGWTEADVHGLQVKIMFLSAVGTFFGLFFFAGLSAPYGKHNGKKNWLNQGPLLPAKACWVLMECPTLVMTVLLVWIGPSDCLTARPANSIILGLFVLHYIQRSFIYPLRIRGGAPMPALIFVWALAFCAWNGYLQVRDLTHLSCQDDETQDLSDARFRSPVFYFGVALFFAGFGANLHSDAILRNLRKPGETGYKIPRGGLFEYVSGANFCAEIFEWFGFAIAAGTPTALCFAIFTFSNIATRAHSHHQWYLNKFKDDYPSNRKAVIPFIW